MIKQTQDLTSSKFGLVKLQDKVRPEVNIKTREEDQTCEVAKLKRQSNH
jgi:hypothetical protein